ncbi:MAG: hypothetical protein JWO38_3724 [Gemmataceae bacterium]|nr:hypothetical protein [Gemmataceae bacterium]
MRAPFPRCWPVALVLAATPVATLPAADPDDSRPVIVRIGDLKPAPADRADRPIRKLQKERFNARLAAAQLQAKAVQAGTGSARDVTILIVRLAENGADLEDRPADRVKWFQMRVDVLRDQEQLEEQRAKAGASPPTDANLATATRADAEIDLLKLKDSLEGKK